MKNHDSFYMEHANITVKNLDDSVQFFQTAFPQMQIRGNGSTAQSKWLHLGSESTYLALNERGATNEVQGDYEHNGINHIGFVVEDVEAIANRLLAAGYARNYPKQVQRYRLRDYFLDADGNEYEFVQYLSDKAEERNDYSE
jgi:catechol 2,3-dioxygenase-like lactoylglutathione lyase family enzyme